MPYWKPIGPSSFIILVVATGGWAAASGPAVRLETYAEAVQVNKFFSTEAGRDRSLAVLRQAGITKIYLEAFGGDETVPIATLEAARDFFEAHGVEASGGMVTVQGTHFGVPSNQSRQWLNFEAAKTRRELRERVKRVARVFPEVIIDDFFATDDTSPISQSARGPRAWADYRMQLMNETIAPAVVLAPARKVHPGIRCILKYPQWYDRFHHFGYDVLRGPKRFDRIWVGTETRNPDTARFGYVMPTQGYINYRWLASIAGAKTGGAWFDVFDCTPDVYRMQSYQSVLAGARELILYAVGNLIDHDRSVPGLLRRKAALLGLGALLQPLEPVGMAAYKPPHSEGSDAQGGANLYIYDYLATMGLAPLPTARFPAGARCVFLARQAACDPAIVSQTLRSLNAGAAVIATPDFLLAVNDHRLLRKAGFDATFSLRTGNVPVDQFRVGGARIAAKPGTVSIRPIPIPERASVVCSAWAQGREIPVFTRRKAGRGTLYVLNLKTFSHDEFSPGHEQFLPPRPLPVRRWPDAVVSAIRNEVLKWFGYQVTGPNQVGLCLYRNGTVILANFQNEAVTMSLQNAAGRRPAMRLNAQFPHLAGTRLVPGRSSVSVTVPAWELAVLEPVPLGHARTGVGSGSFFGRLAFAARQTSSPKNVPDPFVCRSAARK